MKKCVISFILGAVIFSCITARALYVYQANDIEYTPADTTWTVGNAGDALTSLKEDLNNVNTNVSEYKQQITEALADKGVEVNENSSMQDIASGITNMNPGSIKRVALATNWTGGDINVSTILPDMYQSLTVENFGYVPTARIQSWTQDAGSSSGNWGNVSVSYNAETGILSFPGSLVTWPRSNGTRGTVYCWYVE